MTDSTDQMIICCVYRSERKEGTYLYTPFTAGQDSLKDLPEQLLAQLGDLTEVMKLKLTAKRKLAQANAERVMQDLNDKGYYLQLPPADFRQNKQD